MTELNIRSFLPEDEEEIIKLLKTAFPDWAKRQNAQEYWRWKYPLERTMITVAEIDDKVVGARPFLLYDVKIGGSVCNGIFLDDLIVDPEYRQLHVYSKMRDVSNAWAEKNCNLSYAVTTNPILMQKTIENDESLFSQDFNHLVKIDDVVKHLEVKNIKHSFIVSSGLSLIKATSKLHSSFSGKDTSEISIIEGSFDERVNGFWEISSKSYKFMVKKDLEWLRWRYQDPRSGNYTIMQAFMEDALHGFIVLELKEEDEYVEGYIVDLLTLPGRDDVVRSLFGAANDFFTNRSINAVHYRVVKGHPYCETAKNLGFIEPPKAMKMMVTGHFYGNNGQKAEIRSARPDEIYFNYGDYL
jgi:hypothetical protein